MDASKLTVKDIFDENFLRLFSIFANISMVLIFPFFILMIYTVLKKSTKEMTKYRWYLLNCIIWDFLLELIIGLFHPIPIAPLQIMFLNGPLLNISFDGLYMWADAFCVVLLNIFLGLTLCLTYRIAKVYGGRLGKIMDKKAYVVGFVISKNFKFADVKIGKGVPTANSFMINI